MYCIRCGVALADTEKQCPLCHTTVFHPSIEQKDVPPLYPREYTATPQMRPWGALMIISMLFLLPISICLVCDWQINHAINWSGYVVGALTLLYTVFVLPFWFHKPNPVIFVPSTFTAIAVYLLFINYATGGSWFLSFALPVTGCLGLILSAVVALCRYVSKGSLYIFGGASLAMGGFMLLLEYLLHVTFGLPGIGTWSPYPLIVFTLLGIGQILVALCPPLRESLERKFFI